ncbi:hypothetical protein [Nocardioides sp.]|uniref:hypothetical protein n=1 Tax=Nocardioides sp. TaxID=35761 RepID=UPI0027341BAB|nr:hypothetical protein [Nocardioides sp.]MDP3894385.1 hypothetical protein [Nocardioides sp.]
MVAISAWWWLQSADVRRVDAACDTWLEHRESLRTAISETDEAVGRAEADGADNIPDYFNDFDSTHATLDQWRSIGAGVHDGLDGSGDASRLERGAERAFHHARSGVVSLEELIEFGSPDEVEDWLPELAWRFQSVDDSCLAAARR